MKKKNKIIFLAVGSVFIVVVVLLFKFNDCKTTIDKTVKLCTNYGDIVFTTYNDDAPNTVNNFVSLAKQNFYDGLIFHRVKKGFLIQGGDPFCTNHQGPCGAGGPGYKFADEISLNTASAKEGYVRGVVAMANLEPNTNGSQFFIVHRDTFLPHLYTIFGKVIAGQEVVDKIANLPVDEDGRPIHAVVIRDVDVKQ